MVVATTLTCRPLVMSQTPMLASRRPFRRHSRSMTSSSIASVSLPVKVFCWLT